VPLIGFSGSPFTLACYMIEGGGSDDFRHVKAMLYSRPELLHHILAVNAQTVTDYLNAQIDAGAQAVQIFDTWGGALSHAAYKEFSLAYMQRIVSGLKREADGRRVPVIVFTKNGGQWLEDIAAIGADCVGLDWTTDIGLARARVGEQGGPARQFRPERPVWLAGRHRGRSRPHSGGLWPGIRPCLQPGTWHFPACRSGPCRRTG
jgi:uroporphyrinogen decarboxylase